MKVGQINSFNQSFGTKVKINKELKQIFTGNDGGAQLNNHVQNLENNGKNDRFVVAYTKGKDNTVCMHADVLRLKGTKLYVGKSVDFTLKQNECPDLNKIYSLASKNMHPFI